MYNLIVVTRIKNVYYILIKLTQKLQDLLFNVSEKNAIFFYFG